MKKSIVKNYTYNLIYQILVIILPLITTPYVSRILGAEGIGIYSYTISIVTYFTLFGSLGIAMYAQREIAYVQEDKEKRSKIFWEVVILRGIILTIAMICFYFSFANSGQYSIYYKILLLEIVSNAVDISAFFQGMEEFKKIIKRNLIIKVISILSIFIFIKQSTDIWKYVLIYVVSNLIGNLSLWVYLPKYISKINIKGLEFKKHLKPTIELFIPQIAVQLYTVLDKTMIGSIILDKAEVGYYEQSQKIVKIILTIVTSLGTVMLPRIANKFAKGKDDEIKNSIMTSFSFVYFLSIPMVLGMISIAKYLIPWFLGQGFEKSIYIIYIISPIILLIGLSNVIGTQFLLPTKRQKQYTISVVAGAITNIILNAILIFKLGAIGAAIGTVIAETVVTATQFVFVKKEFNIKEVIFISKKNIIAAMLMFLIILIIDKLLIINISLTLRMIVEVSIGIIIYISSLIILKDKFVFEILRRIKSIIVSKGIKCS